MRRADQELSIAECEKILSKKEDGVLSLCGTDGYPYGIPINYVYYNGFVYFHCAIVGKKIDAIENDDRASFCVISERKVIPAEYTTDYMSVMVFGHINKVIDICEKRKALFELARKFNADSDIGEINKKIEEAFNRVCVLRFSPEKITGKQSRRLTKKNKS